MTSLHRRFFVVASLAALAGCSQPSASTDAETTWTGDALVIEGTSDETADWDVEIAIENAPPGEYTLFESAVRPTTTAELATFRPEDCASTTCSVRGLGDYAGRSTLTTSGRLLVRSSRQYYAGGDADRAFYVLVRSGAGGTPDLPVKVDVTIFTNGGCNNPNAPTVNLQRL